MAAIMRTPEDRFDGLLGLTLPMELGSRVTGLLVMNTTLGIGDAPIARAALEVLA